MSRRVTSSTWTRSARTWGRVRAPQCARRSHSRCRQRRPPEITLSSRPASTSRNKKPTIRSTRSRPLCYFHGHGAEVLGPFGGDGCIMALNLSTTVWDLRVTGRTDNAQTAICANAGPTVLERVEIAQPASQSGAQGLSVSASVTVRDLVVNSGDAAVRVTAGGALTLDRAVIRGVRSGIGSTGTCSLQLSNVLVYGTSNLALQLTSGASGTVSSSTFATSGTGPNPRTATCPSSVLVRSSIVWASGGGAVPSIAGCNMSNVIAGPAVVAGASNADPMFVDAAQNDYHLAPGSPARDAVDTGPATDFEREGRPQGARFDIGADEGAP